MHWLAQLTCSAAARRAETIRLWLKTAARPFSDVYPVEMPTLIAAPSVVEAAGNKPKIIREFVGRVNSADDTLSIAHMQSPSGWVEPGQTPEFDEYTLVIRGMVRLTHAAGTLDVRAGQAVVAHAGEWIQYSTPEPEGADYVSVCLPAFSPQLVHRDPDA